MSIFKKNIFESIKNNSEAEIFEIIAETKNFKLERIVSLGQNTPIGEWLFQDKDEWVILLSGRACLKFENQEEIVLNSGDFINIPANIRHRVEWTDANQASVWLALHYSNLEANYPHIKAVETGIREVKVIRSKNRRKTASARLHKNILQIKVPHHISEKNLNILVEAFKKKLKNKLMRSELNKSDSLLNSAKELNKKYFEGKLKIKSIEYVTYQNSKFGCCNYTCASIKISHQVASMPVWVRDYVLVHELAHLLVPNHSRKFWDLVNRYKLAERAKGYLIAKGYELADELEN